ncbi:MAG TPA: bifunctional riboflavin kinase/FAD synthetase [Polyangiales bacterium]|jgi:riboflavin kinase/FMN adenylyltransferase|nr:bifunctional riboflavin kinase/FAD synthetase [Polyangiales bacterium]
MQGTSQQVEHGDGPWVIAPGNHDGVHLGHRALLRTARRVADAHGYGTRALTFEPHPAALIDPARAPEKLTLQPRRAELLRGAGADSVVVQAFTREFAALAPEDFVDWLLAQGAKAIVVGPDFRFGRQRQGDVTLLKTLGSHRGFEVLIEEPVLLQNERVASSAIRIALRRGEIGNANRMLGRFHEIQGEVVEGDRRGRTIGFPTANLHPEPVLPPSDGVYAVIARQLPAADAVGSDAGEVELLLGVANLGTRPTFAAGRSVEVHLFDFDRDIYGTRLRVGFVERVRGEQKFSGIDELRAQIQRDSDHARQLLLARDRELEQWI